MTLNCTRQSNPLKGLLCIFISTAALLILSSSTLRAQVPTALVYAGAGGNDYYEGDNNDALTAKFSSIKGIARDAAGNVYVTDFQNYCIRKISTDGKVSVIAGIPKVYVTVSNNNWPSGTAATMAIPPPAGKIAVADNGVIYFMGNGFYLGKIVNGHLSYFRPASMVAGTSLANSYTFQVYGNYIYRAMGGSVSAIDMATEKEVKRYTVPGATDIRCMGIDGNGIIYVLSQNGQFSRINTATDVITSLVAASPSSNYDLWVNQGDLAPDDAGNVYFVKNEASITKINANTWSRSLFLNINGGGQIGIVRAPNGELFTADQGQCKVFRVRFLQNNNLLSSLTTSTGTLSPAFVKTTSSYVVTVPNDVQKISVTPTVEQEDATVHTKLGTGTYTQVTSGTASVEYDLNVGNNYIYLLVTAQNGSTRSYTVTVVRQGVPPPTPDNLVATPAMNSVKLTWNTSPGANRYKVFRGTSPDNLTLLPGMPIYTNAYTDNTATVGTTYYYAIVAMETTGAESPQGTTIAGRPNTPPVITHLEVTGKFRVGETLTVQYTYSDDEDHDDVSVIQWYRANTETGTGNTSIANANTKNYTLTEADLGKYITVRVRPYDGISQSSILSTSYAVVLEASLPVTLTTFFWKQLGNANQLNWQTATEINSKYFAVERSTDGRKWETIGTVDAAGDSYSVIRYSYTDKHPAPGINFYRLMMVDRDGYTEFSDIIRAGAAVATKNNIVLYPVPASSFITVETGSQAKGLAFSISNAAGTELKRGRLVKDIQQVNIDDLAPGVYFFKTANGKAVKFVKK